jgi:hypothetical protein
VNLFQKKQIMKTIQKLGLVVLFIGLLFGCEDNEGTIDENSIVGNWRLTAAYISSGGPQYWISIDDGYQMSFSDNQAFTSTQYTDCESGTFSINSDLSVLSFEYDCNGFTSVAQDPNGLITYAIETFDKNYFILTPTSGPICIEGCSYKFEKL